MFKKHYTLAEFFSGCGGTSRGFTRSGRFNVVFANDVKEQALQTFTFNHAADEIPPVAVRQDIRLLDVDIIHRSLADRGVNRGDLDVMIGGPPCQGFSQLRRNEHREQGKIIKFTGYSQLAHDPRNDLVLRYLEVAASLQPKFLVIENVPQMLSHSFDGRLGKLSEIVIQILEKDLGYNVSVAVVNCADYGVPQLRERAIFIASGIGSAKLPPKTHCDPTDSIARSRGRKPWVTVHDAICDLPEPTMDFDILGGKDIAVYLEPQSAFARAMRSSACFPYNHVTRRYKPQVLSIIREMRPGQTWDAESERMRSSYELLIAQTARNRKVSMEQARRELTESGVINPVFYRDYYWSAYTRLAWNSPALTITANANFLGSGRFSHPASLRGITVREAARLQSFDDDFRFITSTSNDTGPERIGVAMDMIGEAVPPNLSQAIAESLAHQLDGAAPCDDQVAVSVNSSAL